MIAIARAQPECCCPFDLTSLEVTIGPVSDCEVCDDAANTVHTVEELAERIVQIIKKSVAEFEAEGRI